MQCKGRGNLKKKMPRANGVINTCSASARWDTDAGASGKYSAHLPGAGLRKPAMHLFNT